MSPSVISAIWPEDAAEPATEPMELPEAPRIFSRGELCSAAASVAEANDLPIPFFANLIQQESGWKPHVVSPAGAQGIAQFMPRVARAYGLHNPFDPIHALAVSGKFLRELLQQFGNLGLAAAAYNAGPGRVQAWIAKRGKLPAETRGYVLNITGQPAENWRNANARGRRLPPHARCPDDATLQAQALERLKPVHVEVAAKPRKRDEKRATRAAAAAGKKLAVSASRKVVRAAKSALKPAAIAARKIKPALAKLQNAKVKSEKPKAVAERRPAPAKPKAVAAKAAPAKPGKPLKLASQR
jgi:hypothetical protein